VDNSEQLKNVISFCSGYAGIERGLELAGVATRALAYVEIEAFAAANLVAKMESGFLASAPIWSDLKTFPAQLFRDRVDILTAGYPCQPFSAAGKRAGKDDPRHLWPYIREHIETIRPVRCFFENVEGHISLGLREVIEDLESLDFTTTFGIFSAAEVGAPHQRKRVYILAHAKRDFIRQQSRWRSGENGQSTSFSGIDGEAQPLGNSKHYGLSSAEVRGGACSTSNNTAQRQDAASKFERAGQPKSGGDLPESDILANSDSERQPGWSETNGRQARSSVEGSDEPNLANAISEGSQGRLHRRQDKKRQSELRYAGCGSSARQQQGQEIWNFEPGLGRVVDGCADRVDRLRLLGNGVVPQTAAEAWQVLEQQIWQS
jgi:DNA (cytosine-5)-methyltransferase 1